MSTARPTEGRNAPLSFACLIAALLAAGLPAMATGDIGAALELCADQETDELKLACFEAIAAHHAATDDESDGPAGDPEPAQAPPPSSAQVPASAARPTGRTSKQDAGSEYLETPDEEAPDTDVIVATIVDVTRRNRLLYFEMADGQLWRQMERGYIRYPRDSAFEVEIRRGIMGDYQMRVDGKGRMTRIVRVE